MPVFLTAPGTRIFEILRKRKVCTSLFVSKMLCLELFRRPPFTNQGVRDSWQPHIFGAGTPLPLLHLRLMREAEVQAPAETKCHPVVVFKHCSPRLCSAARATGPENVYHHVSCGDNCCPINRDTFYSFQMQLLDGQKPSFKIR